MSSLTKEQLHTFHARDREIFSKLVLNFARPPAESLLVMATWFWLEDFGFENIFSIIMTLTDPQMLFLANEAVSCYQCISSSNPPNNYRKIPFTTSFLTKQISLQMIYKHRYSAIAGIKNFLNTVCSRIFSDILQLVLSPASSSFFTRIRRPLYIPGFPHPTFGNINVMSDVVVDNNIFNNNLFIIPNGLWFWHANCAATENERTLFITFSRGFPVSQMEVRDFFTTHFGENCVESIYMEEDIKRSPNKYENRIGRQQSLYARLVLDSVSTVDRILEHQNVKKFRFCGKHIRARKYQDRS